MTVSCGVQTDEPVSLTGVEITEYEGEDLSAIVNFRENSIEGPQDVDMNTYRLKVNRLTQKPLKLSYDEVLKSDHYKKVVTLNCVEGWSVDILWEGVLVKDLIDKAGAQTGANTVIFHAYDG